jgi:hypothetical protein
LVLVDCCSGRPIPFLFVPDIVLLRAEKIGVPCLLSLASCGRVGGSEARKLLRGDATGSKQKSLAMHDRDVWIFAHLYVTGFGAAHCMDGPVARSEVVVGLTYTSITPRQFISSGNPWLSYRQWPAQPAQ